MSNRHHPDTDYENSNNAGTLFGIWARTAFSRSDVLLKLCKCHTCSKVIFIIVEDQIPKGFGRFLSFTEVIRDDSPLPNRLGRERGY